MQCALWGFNKGETEYGNPYLAVNVDMLHQADLGLFKTIIGILREIGKEQSPTTLKEMDQRLLHINDSARFYKFRVPGTKTGGYFESPANYAAFEHRSVLQVYKIEYELKIWFERFTT